MSDCDRIEEYLDEELTSSEAEDMARHVESCPACAAAITEYRRLRRLALEVEPVPVPDDLGFRIRQRLAAVPPPRRPGRILRPAAFAGAAAVAAAAILVAVLIRPVYEVPPPKGPTPEAGPRQTVSAVDLDTAVSDWLVQAGNAAENDLDRLRSEAKEQRLLARVRAAIPAVQGTSDGHYLTAVSDLLVQLENSDQAKNGNGPGFLSEEARLVARVRTR